MRKLILFLLIFISLSLASAQSDTLFTSIWIPVRTGDSLAADFYTIDSTIAKPIILIQTPYNRTGYRLGSLYLDIEDTSGVFDFQHYNFVIVDWRGFYGSACADSAGYDRGLDGYDCIEWIASQIWCDGNIGTYGGSALGMIQFQTARHHPPHLVCAAPWIKDYKNQYSYYYCGGVWRKQHYESLTYLGFEGADYILEHPLYDYFWEYVEDYTDYADQFDIPMLLVSGWFDLYPTDVIRAFDDIRAYSDISVRDKHKLIMGPWTHAGIDKLVQGELEYPSAENYAAPIAKRFFDYYLRGIDNGYESEPAGRYFIMGIDEWLKTDDSWSSVATSTDTLYIHYGGSLSCDYPPADGVPMDSFLYDPRDPSPMYGGNYFDPTHSYAIIGPADIRDSVESRDDNLIFSTSILTEPITLVGNVTAHFFVSSNRYDTDFAFRLCDVYPDGRSMILAQGIRRARLRNSYETEELMTPYEIYPIDIELYDIAQTFLAGHKLRVVITSSIFPMFDTNLNNGDSMYVEGDTLVATNFIYHNASYPSAIILPANNVIKISENNIEQPDKISLFAYPNPFNSSCKITISYNGNSAGIAMNSRFHREETQCNKNTLKVFDLRGNVVGATRWVAQEKGDASHRTYIWHPDKSSASGIYLIRVATKDGSTETKRVIYLK